MKGNGLEWVIGGLFLAVALTLPMLFHVLGLGAAFLPMLLPVALAGCLIGPATALSIGLTAPLISGLLTGMPPLYPPVAFLMMIEGSVLALVTAFLRRRKNMSPILCLIPALILDRVVVFFGTLFISRFWDLPAKALGIAVVLQGIPGIVLIMILVPILVPILERRRLGFAVDHDGVNRDS